MTWIILSFVFFLGLFSMGQQRKRGESSQAEIQRQQLELDLAFNQIKIQIAEQGLEPEEGRDLMVKWLEETKEIRSDLSAKREELIRQARANLPKPEVPEVMPVFDGEYPEEFLAAVDEHFRQGTAAIWYGVDANDEKSLEKARAEIAEFMGARASQDLLKQSEEARASIRAELIHRPPLSLEELAKLSPEEQIEEQIYTKIYEGILSKDGVIDPPENGEEWRDRYAKIRSFIDEKSKELQTVLEEKELERLYTQKTQISTQLQNVRSE